MAGGDPAAPHPRAPARVRGQLHGRPARCRVGSEVGQLPPGARLRVAEPETLMLNLSSQERECPSSSIGVPGAEPRESGPGPAGEALGPRPRRLYRKSSRSSSSSQRKVHTSRACRFTRVTLPNFPHRRIVRFVGRRTTRDVVLRLHLHVLAEVPVTTLHHEFAPPHSAPFCFAGRRIWAIAPASLSHLLVSISSCRRPLAVSR
jgi:hypothetical protein